MELSTLNIIALILVPLVLLILALIILYNDDHKNDNNKIENYDGKISNITKVECGTECTINSNCAGFAYRPLTATCYLSKDAILGEPTNSVYLDEYSKLDNRCNKVNKISDEDAVNDSTLTQNSMYRCQDGERNRSELFQYANFGATSLENSIEHNVRDQAVNENSRPQPVRYELSKIVYPDSEVYGPVQTKDIFGNQLNLYRPNPPELKPSFTTLFQRALDAKQERDELKVGDPTDSTNMGEAQQPNLVTDIDLDESGETQTSFVSKLSGATRDDVDGAGSISSGSILNQTVNETNSRATGGTEEVTINGQVIDDNVSNNARDSNNANDSNNIEGFNNRIEGFSSEGKAFVESDKEFLGQYVLGHQCVVNVPQYDCLKFCENTNDCAGVEWNKTITRFDPTTNKHDMYENVCCPKSVLKQMIPRREEYKRGKFYVKVDRNDIPERDVLIITRQNFKDMFKDHIKNNDKFQFNYTDTRGDIYNPREQDVYNAQEPLTESGNTIVSSHNDRNTQPIGTIPLEYSNIRWHMN